MKDRGEIRLDILIKKDNGHYMAHCLQFDLVATDDTLEGVQAAILDLCVAHIEFSHKHDNTDHMYLPAPKEVWNEYYNLAKDPRCSFEIKALPISFKGRPPSLMMPPFMVQEVLCNDQTAR